MASYRAEIEIGVKGAKKLEQTFEQITKLSKSIDQTNKREIFGTKQVASINEYSRALEKARANLNKTRIQLDEAGNAKKTYKKAIDQFVSALGASNQAQKITNDLIEQEISARTKATAELKAYNAAAAAPTQRGAATTMTGAYLRGSFKGGSAYAGPIGPGPASSIFRGQSSPVAERITQQLREQKQLQDALLALEQRSNAAAKEKLRINNQLKETLNDVRVAAAFGPKEPAGFSRTAGEARTRIKLIQLEGAEFVKQQEANRRAAIENFNKVAEFAKKNEATVFGLRAKNIRRRLNLEFDRIVKETKAESEAQDKLFKQQIENSKKEGREFDKELKRRTAARAKAEKEASDLRVQRGRRVKDAVSSGIIGGAFPLLFGQGLGSSVGGGLGGFAGGLAGGQLGFGLSLVGTALGAQFDALAQKAGDLGKALNPLTADIDLLIESAGLAGTKTGSLISALEEYAGAQEAQRAATEQLAVIVGQDGVDALTEYGEATTRLGNEAAKAFTALSAALAPALASIANFLANQLERTRIISKVAANTGTGVAVRDEFKGDKNVTKAVEDFNKRRISEQQLQEVLLKAGREREQAEKAAADARLQGVKGSELENKVARINQTILENKADLTNEAVANAKKEILTIEKGAELLQVYNDKKLTAAEKDRRINLINQNYTNEELKLTNSISKAIERKNKTQRSANKEAERLQKSIAQETLKQDELTQKISLVGKDRLTQVRAELNSLDKREALQRAFIISSTEDVKLQDEKLKTLGLQFDLKEAQLKQTEKELVAQREINALKAKQETANLRRDLTQELENLALPTGDPIDDAFINLQREQEQRRANVFAGIDQAIEDQTQLLELGKITEQVYNDEIQKINDKKAAYLELLPAIEAAQTKQLVYNETLNAVQPAVNSLVFGLRDVANGTKTAEEAFADFLNVIANQFFTIAAKMIAQYIAIGNARNFAFGGVGGGGGGAVGGILGLLFGGAFADGGYPPVGKASLVGEKGPELFVPNRAGKIIPNDEMGGGSTNNISVSVDARQTEVQGNNDQSRQLGTVISRAIQVELAKQQRPGGLLYSTNR